MRNTSNCRYIGVMKNYSMYERIACHITMHKVSVCDCVCVCVCVAIILKHCMC